MTEEMHSSCPIVTQLKRLQELVDAKSAEVHRLWAENRKLQNIYKADLAAKDDQVNGLKKKNAEYVTEIKRLTREIQCRNERINQLESLFRKVDFIVKESTRVSLSK